MNINHSFASLRRKYSQSNPQATRNPWVIGWIGVVVVFLGVNAVFFVMAVVTNPGLVVEDYYEQGRQFEKNALKLMAAHDKLKWQTRLEIPQNIVQNLADIYRFSAVDSRGVPIEGAAVSMLAYRPSDAGADFVTPFDEIAPGLYQASAGFPLQGLWDLQVKVQRGDDSYELAHRISVLMGTVAP